MLRQRVSLLKIIRPHVTTPTTRPHILIQFARSSAVQSSTRPNNQLQPRQILAQSKKPRIICHICDRLFTELDTYEEHQEAHESHIAINPSHLVVELLELKLDRGIVPVLLFKGEEEFVCQICDMAYGSASGLSHHLAITHKIPGKTRSYKRYSETISNRGHVVIDLTE
ncbi:serendipity locus protein delta-like [Halyomorpha halys]|uniref:serendipity locus protein delta-like n=1 Tax=Halyomorpha halys TaxID=286706 RepID=UPI0034D1B1A2